MRLVTYVAAKYGVPVGATLRVESDRVKGDACYHELVFRGDGALGPFRLTLFATPDLRFLSSELFDSYSDPVREERDNAKRTMGQLADGEYAARGSSRAPVTLVVFSDFQCPYCKRLEGLFANEPLVNSGNAIRIVFRHMPLAQHDWAQRASEAAACAQFQNARAFWSLHDGLFENQANITRSNVWERVYGLASKIPGLYVSQFRDCVEQQMSLGAVIRDREMGRRAGATGTPAVFVNGRLLGGIRNAAELHSVLVAAVNETPTSNRAPSPKAQEDLPGR